MEVDGNKITFNKLSAGKYKLEVRVKSDNSAISEETLNFLIIQVNPPIWRSDIAYILYLLIVILAFILFFFRVRKKQQEALIKQKEEIENAKIREISEEKLRFFTNTSHDLRTPLSLILTPVENIMKDNNA